MLSNNEGVEIRESETEDMRTFNQLINTSGGAVFFRATFGQYNFQLMSEMSDVSLIATSDGGERCVGYLSVADCPGIGKEGDAFDKALLRLQDFRPELNNFNTLFVNFMLLDERDTFDMDVVGNDLIYNAFVKCPDTDYIVWLCPNSVKLTPWTLSTFQLLYIKKEENKEGEGESKSSHDDFLSGVRVLVCSRETVFPKLLVRPARIEDNDDLVPILQESNPAALEGQGDYFLADLIQSEDESTNFFVGVQKNIPVGMLATSLDVNVNLIRKVFNTDLYQDMFVEKEKTPPPPPLTICLLGDIRAVHSSFMAEMFAETKCLLLDVEKMGLPAVPPYKEGQEGIIAEEDLELAAAAINAIKSQMQAKIADSCATGSPAPFCVLQGFPRCDAEAQMLSAREIEFDMVLEIRNESDGSEVDESDEFLVSHQEAVEAYQAFLTIENAPQWQRASLGAEDSTCEEDFSTIFKGLVDVRVEELASIAAKEAEEPPKPNAFAITVFCMKDGYESRSDDILRVVFEDHPDLDYSLFLVPNNTTNQTITNTITSGMIRVDLRNGVSFDQSLFICHRDTFLARASPIRVSRLGDGSDESLQGFVGPLGDAGAEILRDVNDAMKLNDMELKDNPAVAAFGVRLMGDLVGVVVVNRRFINNDDINWLRSNFKIEDMVNLDRHRAKAQTYVTQFLMNPVLVKFSRYVMRELMRLCCKSLLYYQNTSFSLPIPREIITEMAAVPPRRRMQPLPGQSLPLEARPSLGPGPDRPLFHLTKRLVNRPKKTVLKRVVVVGGSTASYAFLEKCCFDYANYPHLYLVSDLPLMCFKPKSNKVANQDDDEEDAEASANLFADGYADGSSGLLSMKDADDYTLTEMMATGLSSRVTMLRGRLTDIDRNSKAVVVSDETVVEYDILVLSAPIKDRTFLEFPTTANMHISRCEMAGVFGTGDAYTDKAALQWVKRLQKDKAKWPLVLYGQGLDVIGLLGSLIKKGVPLRRITLVFRSDEMPALPHDSVSEAIIRGLRSSGVVLHRSSKIKDVKFSSYDRIESVVVEKIPSKADISAAQLSGKELIPEITELPCFSLLTCNAKSCDPDLFTAVNNSGIVYDGGVVVDRNFRTVDPNIYAVGDLSCYSRVHSSERAHSAFNACEIGSYVADVILDTHMYSSTSPTCQFNPKNGLPKFTKPKSMSVDMAGGRLFFHSALSEEFHDCNVMLTGDLQSDRLCVLKLTPFGVVAEIAYFGKNSVEARNLSKLVGMHESYLNEAVHSFEEGMVYDWIDFFREEWSSAVYHDKFAEFIEVVRTMLASDKGTYTILDRISDALEKTTENEVITEEWKMSIGARGLNLDENTKRIVETQTIEYLRNNKHMLPKFSIPTRKKDKENK